MCKQRSSVLSPIPYKIDSAVALFKSQEPKHDFCFSMFTADTLAWRRELRVGSRQALVRFSWPVLERNRKLVLYHQPKKKFYENTRSKKQKCLFTCNAYSLSYPSPPSSRIRKNGLKRKCKWPDPGDYKY
jgi:hypothetical protein